MRRARQTRFLISLVGLLAHVVACGGDPAPDALRAPVAKQAEAGGKVSAELMVLYKEHAALARGDVGASSPSDSGIRVVGERVVIDAVAAGDGEALARDLRAIGAADVSVVGRTVSAAVPIAAIEKLESLSSLRSARAAYGQTR